MITIGKRHHERVFQHVEDLEYMLKDSNKQRKVDKYPGETLLKDDNEILTVAKRV